MQQAFPLPKMGTFSLTAKEDQLNQDWLDRLEDKKLTWDQFLKNLSDPLAACRLVTAQKGRTLLHLAVLDNRIDVVQALKREPSLKLRRDIYGLSAIELGEFLDRKECLHLLQPLTELSLFPNLPEMSSFEYLTHPVFESQEGLEEVLAEVAKAKRDDKISAEKIWMGIYFDKEIRKGNHPPVSIKYIDSDLGYGVFADKKISPCAFVGEYTGRVLKRTPKQLKDKQHCLRYTVWEGKNNFCIDAEEKGNFTRFINHSFKPNLGLQSIYWRGVPRMIFVALEEIPAGRQLTFDYGPYFWKEARHPPKIINDF